MRRYFLVKNNNIIFIILLFFIFSFFIFSQVLAQIEKGETWQGMLKQEETFRSKAGFEPATQTGIASIIAAIIKGFLALLGVIFIILILIAGYNWMTAAGDEEKVRKAKDTIQRAIIGLLIIVAAYAITYFVFKYMPWGGGGMGSQT